MPEFLTSREAVAAVIALGSRGGKRGRPARGGDAGGSD